MKIGNVRWLAALACAAALCACGGSGSSSTADNATADNSTASPTAGDATPLSAATSLTAAGTTAAPSGGATPNSPCNLPGGWYFQGACTVESVTSGGAVLVLPSYRGISIAVTFGPNDAQSRVPFILGDAIGDRDISGLLNGSIRFAGFGETKCLTPRRSPIPCSGKALIYLIVVNAGSQTVTFKATPTIAILSANGYPGKTCSVATMVWGDPSRGEAAWVVRPFTAEPNGEKLRFDPLAVSAKYASGATFSSFAIVCRS
jgi:hypothetical protein